MQRTITAWGRGTVLSAVRALQAEARQTDEVPAWAVNTQGYAPHADAYLTRHGPTPYRSVFNLTGTLIHTNLGRAPLSEAMCEVAVRAARAPMTLEYDIETGTRGRREAGVAARLATLTGAEAATLVNNNAAAVLLMLNTLALGKEVPVSRGELIEIGGSFRIPAIMERAGATLVEVGATNRTHLDDYRNAIGPDTAMLLKVHPSNYHIEGFTKEVGLAELSTLGAAANLPTCVDLGSGTLVDLRRFGLPHEPTPQENLADGADLVTFSGDKLLGSVQAGLIVGRADLIAALDANPLKRALRLDKIALAVLDFTLKLYEDPEQLASTIPVIRAMTTPPAELERRAREVVACLRSRLPETAIDIEPSEAQLGSGSLPDHRLPSFAVTVAPPTGVRVDALARQFRRLTPGVVGRIRDDRVVLDMRGADDLEGLLTALQGLEVQAR